MKVDLWLCAMIGLANASALSPRKPEESGSVGYNTSPPTYDDYPEDDYQPEPPTSDYQPDPPSYEDYPATPPSYDPTPPPPPPPDYTPYPTPPSDDYPSGGYTTDEYGSDYPNDKAPKAWKPKTQHPEFFSLKVDDRCQSSSSSYAAGETTSTDTDCSFDGFAIRLEKGIVIATPYNKWWDPKLPIFFVDDDTQTYTVSKKPLELYIDSITGALRYAPVGWLPPNSIATSFYKLGNNPLGKVGPSPAYFAWPTTEGRANTAEFGKTWWLCPISSTGQYQVFISDVNFGASGQGGIYKDKCQRKSLAAINANPWKYS